MTTNEQPDNPAPAEPEVSDRPEGAAAEPAAAPAEAASGAAPGASAELAAVQDRLLRLQADFDNYRKRMLREKEAIIARATEDLLGDILPVVDHFELGLKTAADHRADPAVQEGFRMVYDQLLAALKAHGAEPVVPEGAFDPHAHEAISHVPSDEVPVDHVVTVFRKGFKVGNHLVRPAQVVVSSGPAQQG